jgi:DNA polymerase-1
MPTPGRIHTRFEQAVAATGSALADRAQPQNILPSARRWAARSPSWRRPFQIVSADYSQIELRVLAHLAKDEAVYHRSATGSTSTSTRPADLRRALTTSRLDMRRRAQRPSTGLICMGEAATGKRAGHHAGGGAQLMAVAYFERFVACVRATS